MRKPPQSPRAPRHSLGHMPAFRKIEPIRAVRFVGRQSFFVSSLGNGAQLEGGYGMRMNPNYQPPSCRQILHDIDDIAGQQRFLIYALDRLADDLSDRAHDSRVWLTYDSGLRGLPAQGVEGQDRVREAQPAKPRPSPDRADRCNRRRHRVHKKRLRAAFKRREGRGRRRPRFSAQRPAGAMLGGAELFAQFSHRHFVRGLNTAARPRRRASRGIR